MRTDEQVWTAINEEVGRQERQLELIASENHASVEVMQAMDFVGFNLYRDNWEEFKKIELPRDFSLGNSSNSRDRKLPN